MAEQTAESAVTTVRPSGKVYRRRKPIEAEFCMWNEDSQAVIVYGTHDTDLAHDLAARAWEFECEGPLPDPIRVWLKKVPWDAMGLGYDNTVIQVGGDTRSSTPALRYGGDQ